jgi:glycosyltransferase involved in cell wall biosynthesis
MEVDMVNFAARQKLIWMLGLICVSLLPYPVSGYVHSLLAATGSDLYGALARGDCSAALSQLMAFTCTGPCADLSFSFPLALIVGFGALRRHTRAILGGRLRGAVWSALILAVASCVLWIGILFFSGSLAALDRRLLVTLAAVTALLLLGVRLAAELLRILGRDRTLVPILAALVAAAVIWAGLRGVPTRSLLTGEFVVAALLTIVMMGGAAARRTSSHLMQLLALTIAVHLVFLFGAFVAGNIADLPRGLPILSLGAMLVSGLGVLVARSLLGGGRPGGLPYSADQARLLSAWPAVARLSAMSGQGRRAWVMPLSGGAGVARAQFLAEALAGQGWDIVACVPADAPAPAESWTAVTLPSHAPFQMRTLAALSAARSLARRFSGLAPTWVWRFVHKYEPAILHSRRALGRFAHQHPELRADVVICTDWAYWSAARAVAAVYGAKLVYDVAEYAPDQYFNDPRWIAHDRPLVKVVSRADQQKADLITVSGKLLARRIKDEAQLSRDPVVVPSVPMGGAPPEFREVAGPIRILYKGDIVGERGVRTLIEALPALRPEYQLVLRGAADHSFLGDLKRQVTRLGAEHRVEFELLDDLDKQSAEIPADIGLVLWHGESPKLAYAVPDQLYEHFGAGRGVVMVGAGEAARVIAATGAGRAISELTAATLSQAMNDLATADIEGFKRAAIAAAAELNRAAQGRKLASAL